MKEAISDVSIVDVRTPEEYLIEHFPNAINIPLGSIVERIEEFRQMKKPIIAYCRSGSRSGMSVSILKQYVITEAVNGGGFEDLKQNMK